MVTAKDVAPPSGEVLKKSRGRRRRAGSRTARRRARKAAATIAASISVDKNGSPVKCAVHAFLMRYQSALRKVPAHLPPKIHAGPPTKRVKRVSWRDEDAGPAGGGAGDPAVLAVGPARRPLCYSREQLLRLRESPLVKRALDAPLAGSERLALVLKKRSESPPNEEDKGGRGDAPNENQNHNNNKGVLSRERRAADPRERVRKESESGGIVLSPQRRSFTSGCAAPARADSPPPPAPPAQPAPAPPKPDHGAKRADGLPDGKKLPSPMDTRNTRGVTGRRIGSGRIMVRDSNPAWEETEYRASEPYRPPRERERAMQPRTNGDRDNNRFERRSFGRDSYSSDIKRERDERFNNSEKGRDREDNRRSGGRFSQRRFEKEDEPEWFSGGPTSQLETIELRGFDEPKKNGTGGKENEKWPERESRSPPPERWRAEAASPAKPDSDAADTSNDKDSGVESKPEEQQTGGEQPDFNLDDFLKFDNIPDVLTNGGSETEGSRFSRWFRRDSPTNESRHYERMLHNMVDALDDNRPTAEMEGAPPNAAADCVFAPIAPPRTQPPSLLDLLRRANADCAPTQDMGNVGGKVHSLEELEARLRPQPPPAPADHDLSAFKRLLAQVCGGHAVPAAEPQQRTQPMSLLQMLNKSVEQQQQQQQPPHIPQELLYKLLHVQRQQQQQHQHQQLNELSVSDRELLQRPEAQAILHGLKGGEITAAHLMQQLHNPGLQSRHRDLLLTVLRIHHQQRQMGGSPLPGGVNNPHLIVPPPHHQPLRLSPLPHPGVPPRIPSPRELAAHTQSIMQGALIKKKLEEQRENYRRRQEMQQLPKQPTPISFTPTSVLRKMTAEKESEAPSPKQQWTQPAKIPQGRPIVKGNQSGAPAMSFAPTSAADYQQHYMNQQQMMGGVRPFPQPQQRQQISTSQFNMSNMARGVGGTTLHQLLVQSHQRSLNEMGGSAATAGGGDNQLARWFSPELLARASAGKLPSVHVPNALSLEDLERHHHSPAPPVRN